MTNERAGKADCAISCPMRKQRGRSRPGNALEWENLCIILSWSLIKVGRVYVDMLNIE